jgi:hypothetical protein
LYWAVSESVPAVLNEVFNVAVPETSVWVPMEVPLL